MKYSIIKNNYKESWAKKQKILKLLVQSKWIEDNINPEIVFIIGGDRTFLKATEIFSEQLKKIRFIPIKSGGIGFYTNYNYISDLSAIIANPNKYKPIEIAILEVNKFKVINEIKLINNLHPLTANIYINGELLETFKGTGLVFTTSSGSTGFGKSHNGAVIIEENNIFQMLEVAPIKNKNFCTIDAPVILSQKHIIRVVLEKINNVLLIIDGRFCAIPKNGILYINLSKKPVLLISNKNNKLSKVSLLNYIFTVNKPYNL